MIRLLKSFKTEINPTEEQKIKIHKTIGTCRYIYNFYLFHNKELYTLGKKFMSGKSFSVWLNNDYLPNHQEYSWIREVSSKSVKHSIEDACTAFSRFFHHQSGFPRYKKKGRSNVKMYFVRNNPKDCLCERHRIKIPTLGWVRLKEKGYIPTSKELEKQLRREQRKLSRKYENLKKGEPTQKANIRKQKLKVQKLHQRLENIRTDYINKTISEIAKTKPSHITVEDLNVSGMMKNRHLSKAVASQKFYEFRTKLKTKCEEFGIELRIVSRWYPSSKTCHCCGHIKKDLKLSDRVYRCACGYTEDRDLNAALNLRDAKTYEIA